MRSEGSELAWIRARFGQATAAYPVGLGDDAVVLPSTLLKGSAVLSVDAALEGRHFQRSWLSPEAIGARSVRAALSDLAAMAARAHGVLLSLVLPEAMDASAFEALMEGAALATQEAGATLMGGNLSAGEALALHTTVLGDLPGGRAALSRCGAQAGDALCVTGPLGEAALGLNALQQGLKAPTAIERWRTLRQRLDLSEALAATASAAIDISDGLLVDAARLAEASGLHARLETPQLQLASAEDLPRELQACRLERALSGGEDYELLFACRQPPPWAQRIGELVPAEGDAAGRIFVDGHARTAKGYDHFSR